MRVLIVEDDPFVALDLESIVQDASDAEVLVAPSLADARSILRVAGHSLPDFAFLDIDLMDGRVFEIARLLRERRIPFVFVSASARAEVPLALRDAPFIPKPYRVWQIASSLPRYGAATAAAAPERF